VSRYLAFFLVSLWAVAATEGGEPSTGAPAVVTVYFSERPPYSIVDGQTGILVELTKAVLAEAGVRGRFIELPQARALELLRTGPANALGVGWIKTPDREAWGRFSPPLYQDGSLVALVNARVASGLANPIRLDNLLASGLTLATKEGVSFGPTVDEKIRALGLVPLETVVEVPQMLRMIQAGRMDYTLMSEEEARCLLDEDPALASGLTLVRLASPPPGNLRYLLYPGTIEPALAARIDAALDRIRASDRYQTLIHPN